MGEAIVVAAAAALAASVLSAVLTRRWLAARAAVSAGELERLAAQAEQRDERLSRREQALDARTRSVEEREARVLEREEAVGKRRALVEDLVGAQTGKLEEIAGYTAEQARRDLMEREESAVRRRAQRLAAELERRARDESEQRARDVIATAVQRLAVPTVAPATTVTVPLPDGDMKARIIGKEGRNIRSFEEVTGVNLVVDEVPDAVLLSCFDPRRREIARLALTELVADGRIYPTTIESQVLRAAERVHLEGQRAAGDAAQEARVGSLHPELLRMLGELHFRTSYGQNVLQHSVETAHLAGLMAVELGLEPDVARRAGLLHDIGKSCTQDHEGSHARVGAELAARYGEPSEVCHAIEAHHGEVEAVTTEAVLLQAANAVSNSRPGGRREQLEQYMTRLRRIEELCQDFDGVERVHAMQAGRDVRVMVSPEHVGDQDTHELARQIAERIEGELGSPGQITVTVVRELRATQSVR